MLLHVAAHARAIYLVVEFIGDAPFRVAAFENEIAPFEATARQRKSHWKTKSLRLKRMRNNEKLLGSFELKSYHCGKQDLNLHES